MFVIVDGLVSSGVERAPNLAQTGQARLAQPGERRRTVSCAAEGQRGVRVRVVARGLRRASLGLGVALIFHAANARADNTACGAAYVSAQQLMRKGELRAAREQLIVCAKDCLPEVQRDCTTWLTEVGSSTPTLVVVALDAQGHELSDVSVYIDAERRALRLDGRALEVDPGRRQLTLRRGAIQKRVALTVLQGEKNRRVEVDFPEVNRAVASGGPAPRAKSAGAGTRRSPDSTLNQPAEGSLPSLAWVSAGVGAAGLLGAAYFWFSAEQLRQDLLDQGCAPACPEADKDSIKTQRVVGDVLLGVGLLGASVFGYYWLSQPSSGPVASPLVGGAWAGWQQRF